MEKKLLLSRTRRTVSRPMVYSEFLLYYLIFVSIFLCIFFFIIHCTCKIMKIKNHFYYYYFPFPFISLDIVFFYTKSFIIISWAWVFSSSHSISKLTLLDDDFQQSLTWGLNEGLNLRIPIRSAPFRTVQKNKETSHASEEFDLFISAGSIICRGRDLSSFLFVSHPNFRAWNFVKIYKN